MNRQALQDLQDLLVDGDFALVQIGHAPQRRQAIHAFDRVLVDHIDDQHRMVSWAFTEMAGGALLAINPYQIERLHILHCKREANFDVRMSC